MKNILLLTAIVAVVSNLLATPLIWRGATTIKPMQFIFEADFAYSRTTKTYNWNEKRWDALPSEKQTTTLSSTMMVGFCPFPNFEVCLIDQLATRSQDTLRSFGMGDLWFNIRYQAIASKLAPVLLTFSGALVVPISDKEAKLPIDDGTMDIGLGAILQTKEFGRILAHLRFGYWINGKTDDTTKLGNMFQYAAKLDYNLSKSKSLMAYIQVAGTMEGKRKIRNEAKANTEKDRHNFAVGAVFKALPKLSIRPKLAVSLPFISRGGSLAPYTLGFDFWLVVP